MCFEEFVTFTDVTEAKVCKENKSTFTDRNSKGQRKGFISLAYFYFQLLQSNTSSVFVVWSIFVLVPLIQFSTKPRVLRHSVLLCRKLLASCPKKCEKLLWMVIKFLHHLTLLKMHIFVSRKCREGKNVFFIVLQIYSIVNAEILIVVYNVHETGTFYVS